MLDPQILPPLRDPEPEIPDPSIRVIDSNDTYACVALEPLERGYATTVGNPLRRLLLSSIQGTAVTWVKIEGVPHEYSVIPGVKEEVMDLLLSVKRIRIHALSKRTGKMRLDVTGEGRVCAGDIATASDYQIVNPELHIATLDNPDVSLSIEFNVESGKGYQQVAQGDSMAGLPVGVLPVDAIYNPVRKVDYSVERMMVGQQTDWERLILQVWTDGAVSPLAAIQEASDNLVQHFFMFNQLSRPTDAPLDTSNLNVASEVYLMPIERLDLSSRTLNCLKARQAGPRRAGSRPQLRRAAEHPQLRAEVPGRIAGQTRGVGRQFGPGQPGRRCSGSRPGRRRSGRRRHSPGVRSRRRRLRLRRR